MWSLGLVRRHGIAVPLLFFLFGFLVRYAVDQHGGVGYYRSHSWPMGVTLLLTSGTVFLLRNCCGVKTKNGEDSLPEDDEGSSLLGGSNQNAGKRMLDCFMEQGQRSVCGSGQEQLTKDDDDEADSFCCIPNKRWAQGFMGTGALLLLLQPILTQMKNGAV